MYSYYSQCVHNNTKLPGSNRNLTVRENAEGQMTRRFIVAALVVLCSLTIMTASAFGQAVYGSILGTITDPSGAAVAGAKVTVTSVGKGTSVEATPNADGNYKVTHLVPDGY